MKVRGDKIRRHLVDQPVVDPSRDPEGQWDEGASRGGVTAGWKRPPWADLHDPLPWCPECGNHVAEGCAPGCEWADELEQAA